MTKIDLKFPLKLADGRELTSLTLRRAKVRDLKQAMKVNEKTEDQEIGLIAQLCGLLPEDLEEMDLADYRQLQDAFRAQQDNAS